MAALSLRVPENARGRFYIDSTCSGCYLCSCLAPRLFTSIPHKGYFALQHQPVTLEGIRLVAAVMKLCPARAIGDDGETR